MSETASQTPSADPILVEITRGPLVESRHRAAYALVDSEGRVLRSAGDIERPVYPRSAIKSLQALALVESGAAAAFGLSQTEIALACASHQGEAQHVEAVAAWLARIGMGEPDLACGPQLPGRPESVEALFSGGGRPCQLHNNCSGKHSGMLTLALHLKAPTRGYLKIHHAVQQRIIGILESMTSMDMGRAPTAIDGCGIPTIGLPLANWALAMARLGNPDDQPDGRQEACRIVREACAAAPFMLGGTGDFVSDAMAVLGTRALIKNGAEGVFCASFPELGLGLALKVDDGAARAAAVLMARILLSLGILGEAELEELAESWGRPVRNRAGLEVGEQRALGPEDWTGSEPAGLH